MKLNVLAIAGLLLLSVRLQAQSPVVEVTTDITTFASWTNDNVYLIKGTIYVKGILIIAPGTVIKGDKATKGTLVITRTGQINANAVLDKDPAIVFTSSEPEGSRAPGDWGGIVICGEAPINATGTTVIAAVNNGLNDAQYGGSAPADVSGSMQKVRIEYAGASLTGGARVGGLTLAGVGTGTTLKNIQVTHCSGDGFDIRGGTVNMNQVLSHRNSDDDFDLTLGYNGRIQFAVGMKDNDQSVAGANGIEADNDASGSSASPLTAPTFSNLILVGPRSSSSSTVDPDFQNGVLISGNARVGLYNSVILGYPNGLNIDGSASQGAADADAFDIQTLSIAGCVNDLVASGSWDIDGFFSATAKNNNTYVESDSLYLQDPFNLDFPDFRPLEASPLVGTADFTPPALSAFTTTTYNGAFSRTLNWTLCWTNFDPSETEYDEGSTLLASPMAINFNYDGRPEADSLTVDFSNTTTGAVKYFWNFGDVTSESDTSSLANPTWTYPEANSYEVKLRATGPCDNVDSIAVITFVGLGISDWFTGAELTLFPNPAAQTVWLDIDLPRGEAFRLMLYDLSGRVLRDFGGMDIPAGQHRYAVSLDGIEPGLYLLVVAGEGGYHTEKLRVIR